MLTRDEVMDLWDRGDILTLSTRINRELIERQCPGGAEYGVLSVHIRDGVPDLHIPVIPPVPVGPGAAAVASSA